MNYCSNPVQDLANCISHARYEVFDKIRYKNRNWEEWNKLSDDEKKERIADSRLYDGDLGIDCERVPNSDEIVVEYMFPQTWGSTALGFGGIGGAAMTTAYTIILECNGVYAVYFSSRLAYKIERPNCTFFDDAANKRVKSVSESYVYRVEQ